MYEVLDVVLEKSLSLKRTSYSPTEMGFVAWLACYLRPDLIDEQGNLHFDCRSKLQDRTLFTCHSDTVHKVCGANLYTFQEGVYAADGDVLGADDGAGLAIVAHMVSKQVPGYYIVFRGEEVGGVGSKNLAKSHPELLSHFDHAIAFDRAGYYDVITHQAGVRCCSDVFAKALATSLSDLGLMYAPCDSGVYTDTAELTHIIPECTNLSVGYFGQHSNKEYLDTKHLRNLADAVCKVDWSSLPVVRGVEPGDEELQEAISHALYMRNLTPLSILLSDSEPDPVGWLVNFSLEVLCSEDLHKAASMPAPEAIRYLKDKVMSYFLYLEEGA